MPETDIGHGVEVDVVGDDTLVYRCAQDSGWQGSALAEDVARDLAENGRKDMETLEVEVECLTVREELLRDFIDENFDVSVSDYETETANVRGVGSYKWVVERVNGSEVVYKRGGKDAWRETEEVSDLYERAKGKDADSDGDITIGWGTYVHRRDLLDYLESEFTDEALGIEDVEGRIESIGSDLDIDFQTSPETDATFDRDTYVELYRDTYVALYSDEDASTLVKFEEALKDEGFAFERRVRPRWVAYGVEEE